MSETIGVVGAGQMGAGIAQVAAASGFDVWIQDISQDQLDRGVAGIEKSLEKFVQKEKITSAEKDAILGRIQMTQNVQDLSKADLIVEAATENPDIKTKIFESLDDVAKPDAILATNTSSIPITKIAAATKRPEKCIGMHFMNPVPIMKLVELINGLETSEATFAKVEAMAQKMGKTTVKAEDFPGFLVNRILCPMINEAAFALQEGIASAEDIDEAMKLGCNFPMGPLTLADFIGLDTCLSILEVLHEGLGEDKFRPSPLLRKYVQAGRLGRKVGKGFYTYSRG